MSFKAKIPSFCEINYQQNPRPCFCAELVQAGPMLNSPIDAFWVNGGATICSRRWRWKSGVQFMMP